MNWKDLPNWKLTWIDKSVLLKIDRTKRNPTAKMEYSDENCSFELLKVGDKIAGYKFSLFKEFKCHDEGWYVVVFFEEPSLLKAEPLYEDKNVRLLKVGQNYTFALRWKQST